MNPCVLCNTDLDSPDHERICRAFALAHLADQQEEIVPVIRDTSIMSFYNAVATGVIKTRRQQAWVGVKALGRSTQNEAIQYMRREYGVTAKSHSLTPRFSELRDLGLIRDVGERICSVTGVMCLILEVVPLEEYRPGLVTRDRCETCDQIIRRRIRKATGKPS